MLGIYHELLIFKYLKMTKQEKIQNAYGIYWNKLKNYIDENGWLNCKEKQISLIPYFDVCEIQFSKTKQRPKSIQGIAENNGWIKIESESDLPKESDFFLIFEEAVINEPCYYNSIMKKWSIECQRYPTHYMPIFKPKKPIY